MNLTIYDRMQDSYFRVCVRARAHAHACVTYFFIICETTLDVYQLFDICISVLVTVILTQQNK